MTRTDAQAAPAPPTAGSAEALADAVRAAAGAPILLVACDFDGTLSTIAPRPDLARPDSQALALLRTLAAMPHTHVAVISGRARADLVRLLGDSDIRLIGSHGAEAGNPAMVSLTPAARALLDALAEELDPLVRGTPGAFVERKPTGVAFHYREAAPGAGERAVGRIYDTLADREGVFLLPGSRVVELTVIEPHKGRALESMRFRVDAGAVVFIGDDITDEHAFEVLRAGDAGVKVGPGPTRAAYRIPDQGGVPPLLHDLLDARRAAHSVRRWEPIQRHAILSDQRTVAVVDSGARLTWLCLPRIDSPALFASLVGGEVGGSFEIAPLSPGGPARQAYLGDSLVLRTEWPDVSVTDYFDCTGGRPYQRAGRSDLVRVVEGSGRVQLRFSPRLDFGRLPTRLTLHGHGVEIDGSADPVVLIVPGATWTIIEEGVHQTAVTEVDPSAGPVVIELRYGSASARPAPLGEADRRRQTERFWSGWAATLRLPARQPELVRRSALILKALCHGPTGAIAAAGTTSLPGPIGGSRNWDYRYCWPRDASLAAAALLRLGNSGVAMKLLDWLVGVVDATDSPERLRPIYTMAGSHLGSEAEIGSLPGYADSRPVRVGNAAALQVQLDVFGPIVDVVAMLGEAGAPVTPQYWRLVEAMVMAVLRRWQEPDHGIWEIRQERRHHVHTKVMCWHAVNRAMAVAEMVLGRPRPGWAELRDAIARDVLERGWSNDAKAFTTAYGVPDADAATLHIGLTGLVPPDDPRFVATVEAVERVLRRGPVVYRYLFDDGLPGVEAGFHICTSWLIESLVLVGRRADAESLFESMCGLAGPLGLYSEQHDPGWSLSAGNFPQAYSHLGLINAAVRLGSV